MANKSFFETLTQYRLKVEKDGKSVVDIPGLFALPGLLAAPRLSIAGLVAAPLLGLNVRLENEDGETVDVGGAVRKAAETVRDTAATAAKTVQEEISKAWEDVTADDPEEEAEDVSGEASEDVTKEAAEEVAEEPAENLSNKEIVEELKAQEESDVPVIKVNPEDSTKA